MKCNSSIGHVSPYWVILAVLHSFLAQLTHMIWSVAAFVSQKLICIQSCLISGAWKLLTAVFWHMILPERKALLWIRQYSNPQISRNFGVWCFYLLHSMMLCRLALLGGEEPEPAWALTTACQPQHGFLCVLNLLSSSTQPNLELLVRIWASRAILWVLSAGGPVPSARLSAPHSCSLFPSFKWRSEVLQRWQECSVCLCSLWSSATPLLMVWFAWPLLTVHQCNFHRNMVAWWLENIHGNADFFISIIHPWLWNSLPFSVLHILFSQKLAKTETYDTNPRIRILQLRYSYEEFFC